MTRSEKCILFLLDVKPGCVLFSVKRAYTLQCGERTCGRETV